MRIPSFLAIFVLILGTAWAQEPAKPEQQPKPEEKKEEKKPDIPIKAFVKDGLQLKSEDGNFEMHIGGRAVEHLRLVEDHPDSVSGPAAGDMFRESAFYNRQVRLEAYGTFYKDWEYKSQGDVGGQLQDGWLGWKKLKWFSVRFGQFKVPFHLEQLQTLRFMETIERTIGDRLVPSREEGILLHGKLFKDVFSYEASVQNGASTNGELINRSSAGEDDDGKDVALRLGVLPIKLVAPGPFQGLHLGVAATQGDSGGGGGALADIRTRDTETKVVDMDGKTIVDGDRERLGLEFMLPIRSFGLQAEWFRTSLDLRENAVIETIDWDQSYVTAAWVVTGEDKTFNARPKPKNPFDLDKGQWGMVELAVKYARFRVSDEIVTRGFTAGPGTVTDGVSSIAAGVNWYPFGHARISMGYATNRFDDRLIAAGKNIGEDEAILLKFQVDW